MNFTEYQTLAWTTAKYPQKGEGTLIPLSYSVLGAAGEAGELANKWKKVLRDNEGVLTETAKEAMLAEVGDTLWYLAAICTELKIDLGAVAQSNLDKLFNRQERNVISGSGDNR